MLNYFLENRDNQDVDYVCLNLEKLKKRIDNGDYSQPRREYDECKKLFDVIKSTAIEEKNEKLANAQLIFKNYFLVFCNLASYFKLLQEQHYKSSWNALQDCLDDLKFVGKYLELDSRKEIPDIYDLLECYEKLYPYTVFTSSEYIISKSHCSICGKSMQSLSCPHIKGNLYWGEIAVEHIDEIQEFQAVCLVKHPEDKRCIIELSDDNRTESEKFKKLEQFIALKLPFLQQFTITSQIETRQRNDIIKVGRNEPCSCGSGIKFKKCCGNDLYYKHERNIVKPGKKVEFQY